MRAAARREGHDEGRREGHAAGRRDGHAAALDEARVRFAQEHAQLGTGLRQLLETLERERAGRLQEAERDLLAFALAVARRVVGRLGRMDAEAAGDSLRAALQRVLERSDVVVQAHPDDCESLQRIAPELAAELGGAKPLRIVPDDEVGRGGVRLRAGSTEVDATLEGQIDRICAALLGEEAV
jgi:flagellar assembly protein FliH